jgi:hypothetical protein
MEYVPDAFLNTYLSPHKRRRSPAIRAGTPSAGKCQPWKRPYRTHPFPWMAGKSQPYVCRSTNSLDVSSMKWDFSANQAWVEVAFGNSSPIKQNIGLDDVYRANCTSLPDSPTITYYLKGTWVSEDTFLLYAMRDGASVVQKIVFQDNGVELNIYLGGRVEKVYGAVKP